MEQQRGDIGSYQLNSQKDEFIDKIFYLINSMIDAHYNSFTVDILFLTIQTLQIIGLLNLEWMSISTILLDLQSFAKNLLVVPYLIGSGDSSQFDAAFYLIAVFIFLVSSGFLLVAYLIDHTVEVDLSNLKSSTRFTLTILDALWMVTSQVLFIPFMQLLFSLFRCEKNVNNIYSTTIGVDVYFNSLTKDECITAAKVPYFVIAIICAAVLHKMCLYINQLYYDSRLDCTYKNSRVNGEYEIYVQNFTAVFIILMTIMYEQKYALLQIGFSFLCWLQFSKQLINNMIYNYRYFQIAKLQQAFVILWSTCVSFYDYLIPNNEATIFFWCFGLLCLTSYNVCDEPVKNNICSANSSNYGYVSDAIHQLRILCYAIMRYEKYSLKLDGFLNRHRNDCILPSCPSRSSAIRLKKFNRMLINQTTNQDQIMSIFVIYTIFNNNILKFRGSNEIRFLYALFLLDSVHQKEQSLLQISFLLLNEPTLQQKFVSYRLKKIIERIRNSQESKKLDFSSDITVEEHSLKFKKMLNSFAQMYIHFWQELLEAQPSAHNVTSNGIELTLQIEQINYLFSLLNSQKRLNGLILKQYGIFMKTVLENKEFDNLIENQLANQDVKDFKEEDEVFMDNDVAQYTSGSVIISSQEENFGIIIEVNLELSKIVGYPCTSLLNRNVNMLIPNMWSSHHDSFIDFYLATGQKKFIGQVRETFIRSKQDYSIPIKICVRTMPSQTLGLLFSAQITVMNLLYDYPAFFVIQLNGQIDTISPSATAMFNIELKKVKQGMNIEKIVPDFWSYITKFLSKSGQVMTIKTNQTKMMKDTEVKVNASPIKFENGVLQGYTVTIKKFVLDKKSKKLLTMQTQKLQSDQQSNTPVNNQKTQISKGSKVQNNQRRVEEEGEEDEELKNLLQSESDAENFKQSEDEDQSSPTRGIKKVQTEFIQRSDFQKSGRKSFVQNPKETSLEFFYDLRTNTFLGINTLHQYHPQEGKAGSLNTITNQMNNPIKIQQKSIFGNKQNQNPHLTESKRRSFYPFVYTNVRQKEEELQDMLNQANNNQNVKEDKQQIEIQQILENILKKQQENYNQKRTQQIKAKQEINKPPNNQMNILPDVYLKYSELSQVQQQSINFILQWIEDVEVKLNRKESSGVGKSSEFNQFKTDYGANIKIMRLENNIIKEIKGLNDGDELNTEEQQNQNEELNVFDEQNVNDEGDYKKEIDEIIQTKKNFTSFLKDKNFTNSKGLFVYWNIFSFLFLVAELVYIIVSLISFQTSSNNAVTRFVMYQQGNLYYANTQGLVGELFIGNALDKFAYYNVVNMTDEIRQSNFEKVIEYITIYQYGIDEILTTIYLNQVGVTSEMLDLFAQGIHAYVIVHFESSQSFINPQNLYQATQQILAKAYHLKRLPLGLFIITNSDVGINMNNFSNQVLNKIIEYRDLQHDEIFTYINSTMDSGIWEFIYFGIVILIVLLFTLLTFYFKTLFYQFQVPQILTTIPLSQIRNQIKKCESYVTKVLIEEENDEEALNESKFVKTEENHNIQSAGTINQNLTTVKDADKLDTSNIENEMSKTANKQNVKHINLQSDQNSDDSLNNLEGQLSLRGITSQNFRPLTQSFLNFQIFFPFFIYIILLSVYVAVDSQLTFSFTSNLKNYFNEFQYAVQLEPEFQLLSNCLKSSVISGNFVGVKQVYDPLVYFKKSINNMYFIVDQLLKIHYDNYNLLPSGYRTQFDDYFLVNSNICVELQSKYPYDVKLAECENFLDGLIKQGMSVNISHLISAMLQESMVIEAGGIEFPYKESVSETMYEVYIIITYLRVIMRELNNILINGVSSLSQSLQVARIAVTISITCLIFCNFLFITIPFIQKISRNIFSQRSILSLIPLPIVYQNRHIRQFVLKCYLSNSKQ